MATRMLTLRLEPSQASEDAVRAAYGLAADELDADFGVICLDPARGLYAIRVPEATAARLEGSADVVGVFSDPRIEPFDVRR